MSPPQLSELEKDIEKPPPDVEATETSPDLSLRKTFSGNEFPIVHTMSQHLDTPDDLDVYHRFSTRRKNGIVVILCLLAFLGPLSSTTILAATPDVASTFGSTGTIINLSNAFYMLMSAIGPCMVGPLSELYGRRMIYIPVVILFLLFSMGTALSPTLPAFYIFRLLTGLLGSGFLILGAATIGDIYRPTERGTAMGWFMSGTLIGPGFGPFIGGVIDNFVSWRNIFWLQTALAGLATVLVIIFLPETSHYRRIEDAKKNGDKYAVARLVNPLRVITLFKYPNLLAVGLASSSLVWNMYSLLTPIRYTLNPRFGLTSPLMGGMFFLAPGCGYIVGTFFGGRYSDYTVKRWIKKRNGNRLPQDRLRSCLFCLGAVIPACMITYGWTVQTATGGFPVPIIAMFVQGVAQLICFPSLNTYCIDVMQKRSGEVIGGNYLIRFIFAAIGTAVSLPAIEKIGIGWFSTISAAFLVFSAGMVWLTILYGKEMADWVDRRPTGGNSSDDSSA